MSRDNETTEMWREHRKESQERRAKHRKKAQEILTAANVVFTKHNGGAHLVVEAPSETIDFWPGTGLFISRATGTRGRGIQNLLRRIQKPESKSEPEPESESESDTNPPWN